MLQEIHLISGQTEGFVGDLKSLAQLLFDFEGGSTLDGINSFLLALERIGGSPQYIFLE